MKVISTFQSKLPSGSFLKYFYSIHNQNQIFLFNYNA